MLYLAKMPVFTANLPSTLNIGDKIEIGGKIKDKARKMSVNLCAQEGEEPRDVVLHFDVRFHRDNIISLSRKNGVWIGSGNYDTNYNMFVPGTVFRIIFEVKDTDVITIYCQGKFHSNFLPKIPLTMAKYIVAWADIERITHCYFHCGKKTNGDEIESPGSYVQSPRTTIISGDSAKRCQRTRKMLSQTSPKPQNTSGDSSDDEKPNLKCDGRADTQFYDSLMCKSELPKCGSPQAMRCRDQVQTTARATVEFNRNFRNSSDTEKYESEDYSDDLSKTEESYIMQSDEVLQELGIKTKNRRGKLSPPAQVINFMGKTTKKN